MTTALLSLQNILFTVPFKSDPILSGISLDIHPGDFIILLGSNGSGKSSLIQIINGLSSPTSGNILHRGENVTHHSLSTRAKTMVTLTQDLNLSTFTELTIFENCLISLNRNKRTTFSLSTKKDRKLIADHLAIYNRHLCDKLDEPIASLSGGERQTVAFAMSVWNNPSLLLLDEHTSALDPLMARKLMQLTSDMVCSNHITTLMTTHNLHDALKYGNRLIVMSQGKIVLDVKGTTKELLTMETLLSFYH